jgi:GTPase SAR1 family protein
MLTLGAGECGKSTIWRQLKLIYCGGFDRDEKESMRRVIRINVIADIKALIEFLRRNGQSVGADLAGSVELVSGLQASEEELLPDVAQEISRIWHDPVMRLGFNEAGSIGLGENAGFFLDNVERIAKSNYVPTDADILKSRIRTTGIANLDLMIGDVRTELVDVGGQKSERSRWQKCFQGVDFLLFVVSLSDFDQSMFEDEALSRTRDSMDLFGSIANSPIFEAKPIFLVMNKADLFRRKLQELPEQFMAAYPGFQGDVTNIKQCIDHVEHAFKSRLRANRPAEAWVEAIATCAMEMESVRSLFQSIARKILVTRNN